MFMLTPGSRGRSMFLWMVDSANLNSYRYIMRKNKLRRTHLQTFLVNPGERKLIAKLADVTEETIAGLIRRLILEEADRREVKA